MLAEYGNITLVLALACSVYAVIAYILGAQRQVADLVHSAKNATIAATALLTLAILGVEQALLANDFSYEYVASYSSIALPTFYKLTSLWAGQGGSLLFWAWILSIYMVLVIYNYRNDFERLLPYALGSLSVVAIFFICLIIFVPHAQPFAKLANIPPDGRGLNPLLQHPAMAIHPPILYLGYVGFAVPFAFAFGALLSGQVENRWVKTVRRWTIVPWFFLGIGILLGGKWAYMELGWGGYWAWDPVENAAFMPWLTGTAFLHSIMIQEKKSMLKIWNVALIFLTFILSIFGTFLTRSGVISSVHSFTQSQIGPLFFSFVIFTTIVSFAVLYLKKDLLKSESRIESVVSRESAFLVNNVVFVGLCFAVFWGTVFPVISEAVRGIKITVGPPWFNSVNIPIFLFLLFLTGVGPLVAWRKSSPHYLKRLFLKPVIATVIAAILLVILGAQHIYAIISISLCVFVIATILAEFHRGARARMKSNEENYFQGIFALFKKNKRRYGGYVIHFAVVLIFFGVTGAAFDKEVEASVAKGESVKVGKFEVVYNDFDARKDTHKEVFEANLTLLQDGKFVNTIYPQRHYYLVQEQPTTEVAVHSTFMEDFYVVLVGWEDNAAKASFHFYLKPLVNWVWIGGMILAIGTVVILLPSRQEIQKTVARSRPQRKRKYVEQ